MRISIDYQDIPLSQPFYLFPNGFINNGNARKSNSSVSIDQNEKVLINIDVKRSTIDLIENRRTHEPRNVLQHHSYQIPSPTMTLPTEYSPNLHSTSSKLTANSHLILHKIQRISPTDHFRIYQTSDLSDDIHHSHDKHSLSTMSSVHPTPSPRYSPSNVTFVSHQLTSSRSIGLDKSTLLTSYPSEVTTSLHRDNIENENVQFEGPKDPSSVPPTPQIDHERDVKHETQSLWKNRLTLKTILAMANRDEAKAFKDRKPIDYQMFLASKWTNNSLFDYQDTLDKKFTTNPKTNRNENEEQNFRENRRLFKRILYTMELRKPWNVKKVASRTTVKRRTRKKTIESYPQDDSSLIVYRAVPISPFS